MNELVEIVSKSSVLGVGESSHGTHEFFMNRIEIFKLLIDKHDFSVIAFEDNPDVVKGINQYIQGIGSVSNLELNFGLLYKVWRVQEVWDFFVWLSKCKGKVELVGIDIDQKKIDPVDRDEEMAKNILNSAKDGKVLLWAHNEHVRKSAVDGYPVKPMGEFIKNELGCKYAAIGQFFGSGLFSAATISSDFDENKNLVTQLIGEPSSNLLEATLLENNVTILDTVNLTYRTIVRSFGWGLAPDRIEEYLHESIPAQEFDYVIFEKYSNPTKPK